MSRYDEQSEAKAHLQRTFEMQRQIEAQRLRDLKIIFVVGGPGVGKGTQCSRLVRKEPEKYLHISLGDILREEVRKKDSKWAPMIEENMKKGVVGSKEMTVGLLEEQMMRLTGEDRKKVILIDGE